MIKFQFFVSLILDVYSKELICHQYIQGQKMNLSWYGYKDKVSIQDSWDCIEIMTSNLFGVTEHHLIISTGKMEVCTSPTTKNLSQRYFGMRLLILITEPNNYWGMEGCGQIVAGSSGHWNDGHCRYSLIRNF